MKSNIIPFRVAPLAPAFNHTEEMYCDKKKCCKNSKRKTLQKCPGRLKMA